MNSLSKNRMPSFSVAEIWPVAFSPVSELALYSLLVMICSQRVFDLNLLIPFHFAKSFLAAHVLGLLET